MNSIKISLIITNILESRIFIGMLLVISMSFFFHYIPTYVVFSMWFGCIFELLNGFYIGKKTIFSINVTVFWTFYASFASYCLLKCTLLDFWSTYVLIQFTGTNDTSQYFIGKHLGNTKIIRTSPQKSLEGYIGGLVISSISLVFSCPNISFLQAIFLSFSGILGDFLASFWKRTGI